MNAPAYSVTYPSGQQLQILQGDLTKLRADAIVNAANENLVHGGGLAAAIAREGGLQVTEESRAWVARHGPVGHERPAVTGAGRLDARLILHAVGPIWGSGDEARRLRATLLGVLETAAELGIQSLGLPAISTGIYGFPMDRAARVYAETLADFFRKQPDSPTESVLLVLFDQAAVKVFIETFKAAAAGEKDS